MSTEYVAAVQSIWGHLARVAAPHSDALRQRRRQLVTTDVYGVEKTDAWKREKRHFIERVLLPADGTEHLFKHMLSISNKSASEEMEWLLSVADEQVETTAISGDGAGEHRQSSTPQEFEELCARCLRDAGWEVRRKGGTGDQGVDVIATAHGFKLVLQCKMYSSPVGNTAVQEVFSGMRHEAADWAAVVTNASYTQSAIELSTTTGVLLLHIGELRALSFDVLLDKTHGKSK